MPDSLPTLTKRTLLLKRKKFRVMEELYGKEVRRSLLAQVALQLLKDNVEEHVPMPEEKNLNNHKAYLYS